LDTYQQFGLSSEIQIRLSPGLFEMLTTGARIREIGYVPLVSLNRLRIMGTDAWLKTALDYGLVILASPFLLAFCLIMAVLIKLDSPGPVFHRRRVLGIGGRSFHAYKFRTMVVNADEVLASLLAADSNLRTEFELQHKLTQDPRVTRLGRLIRRLSVDELPQLLNVLLGQMSLVGPRMISQDEIDRYGHWWMNLLTVKPGITGPWQVKGRSELPYDERVRLSMNYIRNYTIWSDLQILYQTVGAVLSGRGAF
jgi:lipopolysaccharide/colanic/teichoic acid biosynthesis glycosyltransferase